MNRDLIRIIATCHRFKGNELKLFILKISEFQQGLEQEMWVDIPEYEGLYSISNMGRVKNKKGDLLNPSLAKDDYSYPLVGLTKNKKSKSITLHRLVAISFIPNPENKPCVNHKDGNKNNSMSSNLEWLNHVENATHAWENGLIRPDYYKNKNK